MTTASTTRRLLRADALFEIALGAPLLVASASGRDRALGLPPPATRAVVGAFGGVLLPFAGALWWESADPGRTRVRALAAVNALTGVTFASWLFARRDQTGASGAALVGSTAATLLTLAAAQARVSRLLD